MRIAVDAMGGDNAPDPIVEGAVLAAREYRIEVLLVGQEEIVKASLQKNSLGDAKIEIVPASQAIPMDGSPTEAIRKMKDSSLAVAARLIKSGDADAMVSAGNTAAALAVTRSILGKLKGVARPAIATVIPTIEDKGVLLDVGANASGCAPEHFVQFAIMGEAYARNVLGKKNPRVGLLNVGEEKSKGNAITLSAYTLLMQSPINFVGNVEGKDIVNGTTDVVVCDGFVGNVILKFTEGIGEMIFGLIKKELDRGFTSKLGVLFAGPTLKRLKKRIDYAEYGGAPLLGINGVCIIGHGKSNATAIKNAVRVASESVFHKVNEYIEQNLQIMKKQDN